MQDSTIDLINHHIVNAIANNHNPWFNAFPQKTIPYDFITNKPFTEINCFLLNTQKLDDPRFLSYTGSSKIAGHIKPNAPAHLSTFWKFNRNSETQKFTLKNYPLFNYKHFKPMYAKVVDIDSNPHANGIVLSQSNDQWLEIDHHEPLVNPFNKKLFNISWAKRIAEHKNNPQIKHVNEFPARYNSNKDLIIMPNENLFTKKSEYYAYLFKMITVATGHKKRLNRTYTNVDQSFIYYYEQLISSMSSAIVCGHFHINPHQPKNQNDLNENWIKISQFHPNLFIDAAKKAQTAAHYILIS